MHQPTFLSVSGLEKLVRDTAAEFEKQLRHFERSYAETDPEERSPNLRDHFSPLFGDLLRKVEREHQPIVPVLDESEFAQKLTIFFAERYIVVPNPGRPGGEITLASPDQVSGL